MIKTIIKRDGSKEPFMAHKLNGWGEWAAKSLGDLVDWSSHVMQAVASLPEECTTQELQDTLIKYCLDANTWSNNRMAGRLYAATYHKELYGKDAMPSIKEVHDRLRTAGFMTKLDYSDEEYAEIQKFIKHNRDFGYAHFQLYHIRYKYALRNRLNGEEMETPQFVFMRMAMALGEDQPKHRRLNDVKKWYDHFSKNRINAPTPNYVNLGTPLNGYASCCLYTTKDEALSLGIGDHIAYAMTVMSAGIGNHLQCRSIGDPIRGGLIVHQGKLPYYRAMLGAVSANMQNGRAGACTTYYSAYDPEVKDLMALKNPMTPAKKQIRGMDYAQISNKFMGRKVARNEDVFLFNIHTAPDLYEAMFSDDEELFEKLYAKYEADPDFKKTYVSARDIILTNENEAFETGRAYQMFADEVNRHTPSKDPIYSSNLCTEIAESTEGYVAMQDLYTSDSVGYIVFKDTDGVEYRYDAPRCIELINKRKYKFIAAQDLKVGDVFIRNGGKQIEVAEITHVKREPEVALCSLGAVVMTNIPDDEMYEDAMYYTLLMIDKCIHKSDYVLPHVGYTAKNRLSAGVGIMDLAHHMARKHLKYSELAGKQEIHRVAERHSYMAIKASLRLGKELGNAPWIHRTKWVEGWMPIDTYNRNVDKFVDNEPLHYDWEDLRAQVIANGGIRNSYLVTYMPGESSSKASGVVNSIYPARDLTMIKTDNDITTYWAAPEGDKLGKWYELAYTIQTKDMIECYGIVQKFTDQSISADEYRRIQGSEKVTTDEMLENYFHRLRAGMKTRYYVNTKTAKAVVLDASVEHKLAMPVDGLNEAVKALISNNDVPSLLHEGFGIQHQQMPAGEIVYVEVENSSADQGCGSGGCTL